MNKSGTGLGLSICKNIIESMGGKVYAQSEIDQGTKLNIIMGLKAFDREYKAPKNADSNSKLNSYLIKN